MHGSYGFKGPTSTNINQPQPPGIELSSLRAEPLPGISVFADENFSTLIHALVEGPEELIWGRLGSVGWCVGRV